MRSNILCRRRSTTPSQLEDLHDITDLLTSDDTLGWSASHYGWTGQFGNDHHHWRSVLSSAASDVSSSTYYCRSRRDSTSSILSGTSCHTTTNSVSSLINPNINEAIEAVRKS